MSPYRIAPVGSREGASVLGHQTGGLPAGTGPADAAAGWMMLGAAAACGGARRAPPHLAPVFQHPRRSARTAASPASPRHWSPSTKRAASRRERPRAGCGMARRGRTLSAWADCTSNPVPWEVRGHGAHLHEGEQRLLRRRRRVCGKQRRSPGIDDGLLASWRAHGEEVVHGLDKGPAPAGILYPVVSKPGTYTNTALRAKPARRPPQHQINKAAPGD